jgi:hypothetical protein
MKAFFTTILILASTILYFNVVAQTNAANPQIICEGEIKNYQVDYLENGGAGTTGSNYNWSVTSPGFSGSILNNQGPSGSSNRIQINWGPTPPGDYEISVLETNDGCPGPPVSLTVRIQPTVIPVFSPVGPFCRNATATALPDTSLQGIKGSWNPATINTADVGLSTYTFTPDPGQCAVAAVTLDVLVDDEIIPVFGSFPNICQNGVAPILPVVSANGIAGSWSPSVVDPGISGTTTYVFTPDPDQCAIQTSIEITVDAESVPLFSPIADICQNTVAPTLPSTSNNGISGAWLPAVIDVGTPGTTTYVFTPDDGQCAGLGSLVITVVPEISPDFVAIPDICENSAAPMLPLVSPNGVTGTWSPESIDVSASGISTYIFTPAAGQCATTISLEVNILPEGAPVFDPVGPLCQNATPVNLPLISNNGIAGVWSPAVVNTSSTGIFTFTFTPDANQCAQVIAIEVLVDTGIVPAFTPFDPICINSTAPVLPPLSDNNISGSWSPATVEVNVVGTSVYAFTPDPGQCAIVASVDLSVLPLPTVVVDPDQSICSGESITLSAVGADVYLWTPVSGLSQDTGPIVTASPNATTTYTVTGTDINGCSAADSITITVNLAPNTSAIFHD